MIILLAVLKKFNLIRFRFRLNFSPLLLRFFRKAAYQSIAMIAIWLKPIVDRAMASWLGEGNVSILYYADRLFIIPVTFVCSGLMATTLSHWSFRFYQSRRNTFGRDVTRAVWMVGLLALLIMIFLLIFHRPIARIAFERGAFDSDKLSEVQRVWSYYLFGLIPFIIARIYFQAHLVLKNTHFLMGYAFCLNGLGVLLNYLLMKKLGVSGIALATTLSYLAGAVGLGYYFYRDLDNLGEGKKE